MYEVERFVDSKESTEDVNGKEAIEIGKKANESKTQNITVTRGALKETIKVASDNKEYKGSAAEDIMDTLKMTAKEMREMLLSRKKKDPRKEKRKDMKRRVEM